MPGAELTADATRTTAPRPGGPVVASVADRRPARYNPPVTRTCPICRKPAAPRRENAASPFCSDRCRLVDLAKWLGEEYRIPGPRPGDGAVRPGPDESPEEDA